MSKQVSAVDLGLLTFSLLMRPHVVGELDTPEKYQAFMTDLAKLICEHCGGEVLYQATRPDGSNWMIGIHGNDSLPEDGGVWKDTAVALADSGQSPEDTLAQLASNVIVAYTRSGMVDALAGVGMHARIAKPELRPLDVEDTTMNQTE